LAAERDAGRRKGGQERSNQARARRQYEAGGLTPNEVQGLLGSAMTDVVGGRLTPGAAQALAALARAAMTVREVSELEQRIGDLEQRAGITRKGIA
jgi:hypothetical protein